MGQKLYIQGDQIRLRLYFQHVYGCQLLLRLDCRNVVESRMQLRLQPPCLGPRSAPIPPVIAEYMSEPVPANVRVMQNLSRYRHEEVADENSRRLANQLIDAAAAMFWR